MSTGNILSAQINVTAPGAKEAFTQVAQSAKTTGETLTRLQQQVQVFGGGVNMFTNNFKKIAPAVERAENSFKKLSQTSNSANNSLINLGRVVQDAPFGFLGIANNLNPLLESFQRLQKETGSTSGALKGLAGSMLGAGGLGFALSAASSLLIVFGDKLLGSSDAARKSADALESYRQQIDFITTALEQFKGRVSIQDQLADILAPLSGVSKDKLLTDRLQRLKEYDKNVLDELERALAKVQVINDDNNLSDSARKDAIENNYSEIQRLNKEHFKNVDDLRIIEAQKLRQSFDASLDARKKYLEHLKELRAIEAALLKPPGDSSGEPTAFPIDISTQLVPPSRDEVGEIEKRVQALTTDGDGIKVAIKLDVDPAAMQKLIEQSTRAAQIISDTLTPAFEGLFDNITSGGDAMKGFFDGLVSGVKSLISQLIKAAVFATVLNAILGKGSPGFGALFGKALGFAEGGYTGSGGKYDPAGIVHKGEFVVPQHAVNRVGLPFLNNLAFGRGIRGYASGGFVGTGIPGGGTSEHKVIFKIAGQELVGLLSLSQSSLGRLT